MTVIEMGVLAYVAERQGANGEHEINPRRLPTIREIRKAVPGKTTAGAFYQLWESGHVVADNRGGWRQPRRFALTSKGRQALAAGGVQ